MSCHDIRITEVSRPDQIYGEKGIVGHILSSRQSLLEEQDSAL